MIKLKFLFKLLVTLWLIYFSRDLYEYLFIKDIISIHKNIISYSYRFLPHLILILISIRKRYAVICTATALCLYITIYLTKVSIHSYYIIILIILSYILSYYAIFKNYINGERERLSVLLKNKRMEYAKNHGKRTFMVFTDKDLNKALHDKRFYKIVYNQDFEDIIKIIHRESDFFYNVFNKEDDPMMNHLKEWRKAQSQKFKVPSYKIFTNKQLTQIIDLKPKSRADFFKIKQSFKESYNLIEKYDLFGEDIILFFNENYTYEPIEFKIDGTEESLIKIEDSYYPDIEKNIFFKEWSYFYLKNKYKKVYKKEEILSRELYQAKLKEYTFSEHEIPIHFIMRDKKSFMVIVDYKDKSSQRSQISNLSQLFKFLIFFDVDELILITNQDFNTSTYDQIHVNQNRINMVYNKNNLFN